MFLPSHGFRFTMGPIMWAALLAHVAQNADILAGKTARPPILLSSKETSDAGNEMLSRRVVC